MSKYQFLFEEIKASNLYRHVLNLQGVRHPLTNPSGLIRAQEYIAKEFEKYGLDVIQESFHIDGCEMEFKNIIGVLENPGKDADEIVLSCHHDTVYNAPGANDNASACAVILELARVLTKHRSALPEHVHLRFVSFDLEEQNPVIEKRLWDIGERTGIRDKYTFTSLEYKTHYEQILPKGSSLRDPETREQARKTLEELSLIEDEQEFFTQFLDVMEHEFQQGDWVGHMALLGSSQYVKNAVKEGRTIKGVINLDTIGYTTKKVGSQGFPKGFPIRLLKILTKKGIKSIIRLKMFQTQNVKDITQGDYINLITDNNSRGLAEHMFTASKKMRLPIVRISLPYSYQGITKHMPDMLRSDHAPFWKEGVPGVFLTDSANFRYPFYHTEADMIQYLDFGFMQKIAQIVGWGVLSFAEE